MKNLPLLMALVALVACGEAPMEVDENRPDLSDLLDAGPAPAADAGAPAPAADAGEAPEPNDAGTTEPADAGPPEPVVIEEVWAMKTVTSVLQTNPSPFGNDEKEIRTTSYLRAQVSRTGEGFDWEEVLCHMETSPVRYGAISTETNYPAAFVTHFPVFQRTGRFQDSGDFHAGPFATVVGAELDNPLTDPLPESAGEAGEVDADRDGNPGVTVEVSGTVSGEVYVVQRNIITMRGRVRSEDRVEGLLNSEGAQIVLDASNRLLRSRVVSRRNPDDAASYFVLSRVEAGTSCDQIVDRADDLF